MTTVRDSHQNNIVIGAGEVYFDEEDSSGALTGERYLGDSLAATLGATVERTQIFRGDGAVGEPLADIVRSVERTIGFTLHDMSLENWDLFILGGGVSNSGAVAAARVAGGDAWGFTAQKGRWYQIGATSANPSGIGPVKNAGGDAVQITPNRAVVGGGNAIIAAAANYDVDEDSGRIYIKPDAAGFADGTEYYIHYTPKEGLPAGARRIARTGEIRQRRGAVRYIESPSTGKGRNIYARRVVLAPAGEAALKARDTEQQLQFTGSIVAAPSGSHDLVIDGVPAA